MVRLDWHVLLYFDLVDGLENGEAVADAVQADLFELGMLDLDENLARKLVLCWAVSRRAVAGRTRGCSVPMKVSWYCFRPRPATKSATCSLVHSVIRPVGLALMSREWVKVVGVCSVLMGPDEVGELSG